MKDNSYIEIKNTNPRIRANGCNYAQPRANNRSRFLFCDRVL